MLIIAMMVAMTTVASTATAESNHEETSDYDVSTLDEGYLLEEALAMLEEVSDVEIIVVTDGQIAEVTVIVNYVDGESEMIEFRMDLEEIRETLANHEGDVEWESQPSPPPRPQNDCDRGYLHGTITMLENDTGEIDGVVINLNGEVVGNMWGTYDANGFASGYGSSSDSSTSEAAWKVVYDNGRFTGFWETFDIGDDEASHGKMKGHYKVNESNGTGEFHGKWKEYCQKDAQQPVVEDENTEDWTDEEEVNGTSEDWTEEGSEEINDNSTSENGTVIDVGSMKVLPGFTGVIGMVALMGGAVLAGRRSGLA
jgi:hypothetical protein